MMQEILVGPALSGFVETDFLHVLFRAGVLQYFDAVSIHGYSCSSQLESLIDAHAQLSGIIAQYDIFAQQSVYSLVSFDSEGTYIRTGGTSDIDLHYH